LFIADVNSAPNSFMTNGNAGMGYIKLAMDSTNAARKQGLFDTAIMYLRKSIGIFKNYDVSYYNLGVCYLNSGNVDMAKIYWDSTKAINPTYPPLVNALPLLAKALFNKGQQYHGQGNVRMALKEIKEALFYDSQDPDIWYNLGGAYYTVHEPDSARYCWSATLQLNPNYAGAKQGLAALPKEIKDTVKGVR
jgi:tetratricopeptide (TPR) repeat protein